VHSMVSVQQFVGFIDGTKIQISRPSRNCSTIICFSGHKILHCFSYQTISTPDGLVFHLYGPEEGRIHYFKLYWKISMNQHNETNIMGLARAQYCIYGDGAYSIQPCIQVGFFPLNANVDQLCLDSSSSAARVCVE
jgi:hypothetical protein